MNSSELTERGIGFQAIGFGLVGSASVAILELFSGSDFWVYSAFEIAATKLHWSFALLLAVTFDWGRRMFEKAKAIRDAHKTRIREEGIAEGREEGIAVGLEKGLAAGREEGLADGISEGRMEENARVRTLLDRHDVSLPPEVLEEMFGGHRQDQS